MIDPTPFIGPAYEVYKHLKDEGYGQKGKERLGRLLNWVLSGETQVAIFGAGGTGKTTLGKLLLTGDPSCIDPQYNMSDEVERISIPGPLSAAFNIVPGQEDYVATEWKRTFSKLENARSVLVVNVVSYGYHSLGGGTEFERGAVPDQFFSDNSDQFFSEYAAARREKELTLLDPVLGSVINLKKPVRFMTIVSKEDLWWSQYELVSQLYSGAYLERIEACANAFRERGLGFQHSFMPVSQVHANLDVCRGRLRRVIKGVSEGYDLALHLSSVHRLLREFDRQLNSAAGGK